MQLCLSALSATRVNFAEVQGSPGVPGNLMSTSGFLPQQPLVNRQAGADVCQLTHPGKLILRFVLHSLLSIPTGLCSSSPSWQHA